MTYCLEDYCVNGILLLDGGMGQELRRRSQRPPTALWSAQALLDEPHLVQDLHEDYIRAGARVIITNTYTTIRRRLQQDAGIGDQFAPLMQLGGKLAMQARESVGIPVLIAGSLPPLFGSYRPDQVPSISELESIYEEHVELLSPYVDLFLCETLSTAEEGRAAVRTASRSNKPVWVSWTLTDQGPPQLRSGQSLQEAWQAVQDLPIEAALVNCSPPESITAAIPELVSWVGSVRVGGYANGFEQIPANWTIHDGISALGQRRDLDPENYAVHVQRWITAGATIVGGCCETGPAHIQTIAERLK